MLASLCACRTSHYPQLIIDGFRKNGRIEKRKELNAPVRLSITRKDRLLMVGTIEDSRTRIPLQNILVTLYAKEVTRTVLSDSRGEFTFPINDRVEKINIEIKGYDMFTMTFLRNYWDPLIPQPIFIVVPKSRVRFQQHP